MKSFWSKSPTEEEEADMSCRMVCTGEGATPTSGGKCMRPGPMTRNGYLNFLREYRQKHCGLTAVETVRQGAFAWNKLSQEEKNRYKQMVIDTQFT